jgi:hypothetical protein
VTDGDAMSATQIVEDDNLLVFGDQLVNHRAADVAGAAGYQNSHL